MLAPLALVSCLATPAAPADRPVLSGPELTYASADGLLLIHYTRQGADALSVTDDIDPANGVPDEIDWIVDGIARVHQAFVVDDGWPAPISDEGAGGDDRVDVYVRDIDANGFAYTETTPSGDTASYIELDPANAALLGKTTFESIAGHEYHHVLQFRLYTGGGPWIYEASATYAQYLLFHDDLLLDLARNALWVIRLANANVALAAVGDPYEFEYAGMVWVKYLVDRGGGGGEGDRKLLLHLWQAMGTYGDWRAGHDSFVAADLGLADLDAAAADFAVWNWFACGNDDGRHYASATLPCGIATNVPFAEARTLPASGTSPTLGALGSAYVAVDPDCASAQLAVTARPTQPTRFHIVRVGTGPPQVTQVDVPGGGDTTIPVDGWNAYARVVVVATNLGAADGTFAWAASATGTYATPDPLPAAKQVTVAPQALALADGESATLVAHADFGTCEDGRDVSATATWQSSDETVARVAGGKVTAAGPGTADVRAYLGTIGSDAVRVTVTSNDGCDLGGAPGTPVWALFLSAWAVRRGRSHRNSP
jgi:hypothetical protein